VRGLDGQVAIVTGAGSGIGLGIAEVLHGEGAAVVIADLDADRARAVAARLGGDGGDVLDIGTDVTNPEDLARLAAAAIGRWGPSTSWPRTRGSTRRSCCAT
jgi:7-alpha-hydroxysteroid dehydrogenase